jgi:hypothetical protein
MILLEHVDTASKMCNVAIWSKKKKFLLPDQAKEGKRK